MAKKQDNDNVEEKPEERLYDEEDIEQTEERLRQMEEDQDYSAGNVPEKWEIFKFLNKILESPDATKTANLSATEIGMLRHTVRRYFEVATFSRSVGLDKVADYLADKAQITLATSMSKKGFMMQLAVTQIRRETKVKETPPITKSGLFSRGQKKDDE